MLCIGIYCIIVHIYIGEIHLFVYACVKLYIFQSSRYVFFLFVTNYLSAKSGFSYHLQQFVRKLYVGNEQLIRNLFCHTTGQMFV